jgi:hypothetical protein
MAESKIAILAGCPRVGIDKNGELLIDPQLEAFEEAMKIVSDCREQVTKIVMLFDHRRIFRKRFVDKTLDFGSNSKKNKAFKHLRMSHLLSQVRRVYEEMAQRYKVPLDQIRVLSEDMCRLEIFRRAQSNRDLKMWATGPRGEECAENKACSNGCGLDDGRWEEDVDGEETPELQDERVTCPGIAAAAITYLAKGLEKKDSIITCWQYDPKRVTPRIVVVGTQIATEIMGVENPLEIRCVRWPMSDGTISDSTIVKSIQ